MGSDLPAHRARNRQCHLHRSGGYPPICACEIYALTERLDADEELLAIIGSWRDTLDDAEVGKVVLQ